MENIEAKAPKPWEISLCRGLDVILSVSKLLNLLVLAMTMLNTPIIWPRAITFIVLSVALYQAHKHVQGVLTYRKKNDDSISGE